jgi:plastocyanin
MKRGTIQLFWLGALLIGAWQGRAEVVIEGHVTLPNVRMAPVRNERYEVVTKGGVVAMNPPLAVVYVEGSFVRSDPPAVVQMAQKDLAFVPALLAVQVGTRIEFPNLDDTYHNIFSYSAPKRFDLGRYRKDEVPIPSQVFGTPGLVTLRCDIHEHMRGLILVVATPYFVVTDATGAFRLTGLPAGNYVVKAWLSSRTTLEKRVEVLANAVTRVDFP